MKLAHASNKIFSLLNSFIVIIFGSIMIGTTACSFNQILPSSSKFTPKSSKIIPSNSGNYQLNFSSENKQSSAVMAKGSIPAGKFLHLLTYAGGSKGSATVIHWIERNPIQAENFRKILSTTNYNEEIYYTHEHFKKGKWNGVTKVDNSTKILSINIEEIDGVEVHFIETEQKYKVNRLSTFESQEWLDKEAVRVYLHAFILNSDFSIEIFHPLGIPIYSVSEEKQEIVKFYDEAKNNVIHFIKEYLIIPNEIVVIDSIQSKPEKRSVNSSIKPITKSELQIGNNTYPTFKINNLTWMAKSLNYNLSGSICYENQEMNCQLFGRLYTWEQAKKACENFGWRLPSDTEWTKVANYFGGFKDEVNPKGKLNKSGEASYKEMAALLEGGKWQGNSDGFFGGMRGKNGDFFGKGIGVSFWTSTEGLNDSEAILFYLNNRTQQLGRSSYEKSSYNSCLCVKE